MICHVAERSEDAEIDDHHWGKQRADLGCAAFLITNRKTSSTSAIGMTNRSKRSSTTVSPSTADSTEIAGVIMLSP